MNLLKPTTVELKCMDCHAKTASVTNKPCNHTILCRTCSRKHREKNGDVCSLCEKTLTNPVYVPPTQIQCDMCYDDFAPGFTVRASDDCNHHFCVRCMVDKFRFSLKNKKEAFDARTKRRKRLCRGLTMVLCFVVFSRIKLKLNGD